MKRIILSTRDLGCMERLADRIKLARLNRNLKQTAVAERAGISRSSYLAIERGDATVSLATLLRVMAVFGYENSLDSILSPDPIGDEMALFFGRKRAGGPHELPDF